MPELPEVEIVCRNLNKILGRNSRVKSWLFFRQDLRFKIPQKQLLQLRGQKIQSLSRRAKYLIFYFEEMALISHLGMTGEWRTENSGFDRKSANYRKHDHVCLQLEGGVCLVYHDPRRFGFLQIVSKKQLPAYFAEFGVEPLDSGVDFGALTEKFKGLKGPIKSALMNQKLLVGVGNIYASEALYRAGIYPFKSSAQLSRESYGRLWGEVRGLLTEAIKKGGSTIENYRNAFGEAGEFQKGFYVYGRQGEECRKCHTPIKSRVLSGRSTFWCPSCQKK
jgi:formamidopyrimidine-DNA glycosylase